jgi:protein SCO1/2
MSNPNKMKKYIVLGGMLFLFPLVWFLFFGVFSKHNFSTLPYFSPEAPKGSPTANYHIPEFAFSNQDGIIVTDDSLKGKVWLAAFYDLANPHLAKITERLLNVNFKYRNEPDIRIVVFSTNSDNDTQPLVQQYVEQNTRYNSFPGKWEFLTGNQEAMNGFIRNGFLIQDLKNDALFRLVDGDGCIRGVYGNTEYHFVGGAGDSIPGVIQDIALLKKEIDLKKYNERKAHENRP